MRNGLAVIGFATGAALFTSALAHEPGPKPTPGSIRQPAPGARMTEMSPRQVIGALEAQGYRDFRKLERAHGRYEVTARNPAGRMVKLHVDPAAGRVLQQVDDD